MRRRRGLVALLSIAVLLVPALMGCGKTESSGTASAGGNTVGSTGAASSASTGQAVQDKIKADKDLTGADIKVSEQNGTIVLDGTVANPAQKDKAEQIVYQTQKEKNQQAGVMDNLLIKESGAPAGGGQ